MNSLGPDETVRLKARPSNRRGGVIASAGIAATLLAAALATWLLRPPASSPPIQQGAVVTAPAPGIAIGTANEADIRAHTAAALTVFHFSENPDIIVLDFPDLEQQGLMLDRVAALTEKLGLPRDRVLPDSELTEAIHRAGDTVATYYYGHDYSAAELARFFNLAEQGGIHLNAQEEWLRGLLRQLGWLSPDAQGGLISIPPVDPEARVTPAWRRAILHHELSHGEFFSNPAYADYVRAFWHSALTDAERRHVRDFLRSEDYDPSEEELMLNEMQAYLMFTHDPDFFSAEMIGMPPERLSALQAQFRDKLPVPWLRRDLQIAR